MPSTRRALLSVTNKDGLLTFAGGLRQLGFSLISTGGTARMLRNAGLEVQDVAEVTQFPEMLDGRVKTIHPRIAAGILADMANPIHSASLTEQGISPIDLVVVNLYDFQTAAADPAAPLESLIENIDIGGPTMIRAAAKNFGSVAVVTDPADYDSVLRELEMHGARLSHETRWTLAKKAFALTAAYDTAISRRLDEPTEATELPRYLKLQVSKRFDLRYGENPHQSAALYSEGSSGIGGARQLHGKELSYNNLVDLDAAWQLIGEFSAPAAAIIKHTNPCGCAEAETLAAAYRLAYEADPVSAFGGVLAFNRELDEETAHEITKTFIEAIAAPAYTEAALPILQAKKGLRLLAVNRTEPGLTIKTISGGLLVQTEDSVQLERSQCRVVSARQPTDSEWLSMEFGWKVCKHVKSNAIVYSRPGQLVAAGAGQMSRVDSVRFGAGKALLTLEGSTVASDAFFPFADGLEEAARHGITAAIEPGGSVRDQEVIEAANQLGLALVFTGIRHFRH